MMDIEQETLLRLCELTEPCIACHGTGIAPSIPDFEGSTEVATHSFCTICHGEKVVPLLDPKLVRVRCPNPWESMPFSQAIRIPVGTLCPTCQSRGWIPSPDPWAYVRAVWWAKTMNLDDQYRVDDAIWDAFDFQHEPQDPGPAILAVLAALLLERNSASHGD